jgi:hypothetical protein
MGRFAVATEKKKPKITMSKVKIIPRKVSRPLNAFERRIYQKHKTSIDHSWKRSKGVLLGRRERGRPVFTGKNDYIRAFIRDGQKVAAAGKGVKVNVTYGPPTYERAVDRLAGYIADVASLRGFKGTQKAKIAAAMRVIKQAPSLLAAKRVERKVPAVRKVYTYTFYVHTDPSVRKIDNKTKRTAGKFTITSSKPVTELGMATLLAQVRNDKLFNNTRKDRGITRITNERQLRDIYKREVLTLASKLEKVSEKTIRPKRA